MINKNIYDSALSLLSESVDSEDNEDLEERAPYLIAAFCSECSEIDERLRKSEGQKEAEDFNPVWMPLDARFPLVKRLAHPASLYLAAMLIIDEDPTLSDKFYDMYCDEISKIATSIPALLEPICDRYYQ